MGVPRGSPGHHNAGPWAAADHLSLGTPLLSAEKSRHTTLCSNDTALSQGTVKKLKVGLLEEALGGALGVGGVGDDDVEGVLIVVEELEAVGDVDGALGVGEAGGHLREVFLGKAGNGLFVWLLARQDLL